MRTRPRTMLSQPSTVMITRQSITHTLWTATSTRPSSRSTMPNRIDQRGLPNISFAMARVDFSLIKRERPTANRIGPISLAINIDVCMAASGAKLRNVLRERGWWGQEISPCPFAGMTRIRFKGFFSALSGHPSELLQFRRIGAGAQSPPSMSFNITHRHIWNEFDPE